jgi:ABC-type dipeptide/oligopeptide/nickel transport system permease subunit
MAAASLGLAACSGINSTQQRILSGGAIGLATGAGIGAVAGGLGVATGAAIGAAAGAAGGLLVDSVSELARFALALHRSGMAPAGAAMG